MREHFQPYERQQGSQPEGRRQGMTALACR